MYMDREREKELERERERERDAVRTRRHIHDLIYPSRVLILRYGGGECAWMDPSHPASGAWQSSPCQQKHAVVYVPRVGKHVLLWM